MFFRCGFGVGTALRTAVALVAAVAFASAEPATCGDCLLGVYDDRAMTRTSGQAGAFQVKSVYLGLRLPPGVSIADLRFQASYPNGFMVVGVESYVASGAYDTQGNTAFLSWERCVTSSVALFRVGVLSFSRVRDGVVQLRAVVAHPCDDPTSEGFLIPAGCYVLNPTGSNPPCSTAISPTTWSVVKDLFRTTDSR